MGHVEYIFFDVTAEIIKIGISPSFIHFNHMH